MSPDRHELRSDGTIVDDAHRYGVPARRQGLGLRARSLRGVPAPRGGEIR
ncbi:hypothetical protein ACFPK1_27715 [Actinomycetospora rhizophila]|uniref:Uncharacterized protein n=1 Tax=Actinomycetospora rhizophila TaxID=1416876 RepID=A0ABV9ZLV3_9PSEU